MFSDVRVLFRYIIAVLAAFCAAATAVLAFVYLCVMVFPTSREMFAMAIGSHYIVYATAVGAGVFALTLLVIHHMFVRKLRLSVIVPVRELIRRTSDMADGDLDTVIPSMGDGAIAELSCALERMRVRLQDMAYTQQGYDDNRRFLVSALSHDLKTPIAIIKGYLEGVADGVAAERGCEEKYIATALHKTNELCDMLDDLLLYAQLDLRQLPFDLRRTDMAAFARDLADEYAAMFASRGYDIVAETSAPLYADVDGAQFGRVAQNIIENALRYLPERGGRLRIVARGMRGGVILEFRDNGSGVSDDALPHIFERFYQSNAARDGGRGGLGLAICKQLVEGMGGRIWAAPGDGSGCAILISLPWARSAGENAI